MLIKAEESELEEVDRHRYNKVRIYVQHQVAVTIRSDETEVTLFLLYLNQVRKQSISQ